MEAKEIKYGDPRDNDNASDFVEGCQFCFIGCVPVMQLPRSCCRASLYAVVSPTVAAVEGYQSTGP